MGDQNVGSCSAVICHEALTVMPKRAIDWQSLARILDQLTVQCGLPKGICTDNGKNFCGLAILM